MAKSDYGRDMFRQLTEVMARLEKVEETSRESERKHEAELRNLKIEQKRERYGESGKSITRRRHCWRKRSQS